MRDPSITQQLSLHLLRLQNKDVRLIKNLNPKDHDHLSQHYQQLQWLPFSYLFQFRCIRVMFHQYHHIPLESSIHFDSTQTHYDTRVKRLLIGTILLSLSVFLRYKASYWWNNVPPAFHNAIEKRQFNNFYNDYFVYVLSCCSYAMFLFFYFYGILYML